MTINDYLRDTFRFNDWANRKILEKVRLLPDPGEPMKFLSHLVNSQYKWMERIRQNPQSKEMSWWDPLYPADQLQGSWINRLPSGWTTWKPCRREH